LAFKSNDVNLKGHETTALT